MRLDEGTAEPDDVRRFWEVLERSWEAPPDNNGFLRLRIDKGEADVYAGQPGEPCDSVMINHFGGYRIMDAIVEAARVGDFLILGPGLPPCLTRPEQHKRLAAMPDLGEPVLISSGKELTTLIRDA